MAIGAFVVMELGLELIHGPASPWQVSPLVTGPYQFGTYEGLATFYPYLPDLSIAQLIFLGGLTAALLGSLGLPAAAGRQSVRRTAAALTVARVLAAGSGIALAGTGRLDPHGMIAIPALHNRADDQPVSYTAVCSRTAIPVCMHPAYVSYLAAVSAALAPVLDQLVDVPGAPSRIEQTTPTFRWTDDGGEATAPPGTIRGTPPVCTIVLPNQNGGLSLSIDQSADQVRDQTVRTLVAAVVGTGSDSAQRAVTAVILGSSRLALDAPIAAAAQRFAVLPASTRHAWLIAHAADLRAGRITLEQLP